MLRLWMVGKQIGEYFICVDLLEKMRRLAGLENLLFRGSC